VIWRRISDSVDASLVLDDWENDCQGGSETESGSILQTTSTRKSTTVEGAFVVPSSSSVNFCHLYLGAFFSDSVVFSEPIFVAHLSTRKHHELNSLFN